MAVGSRAFQLIISFEVAGMRGQGRRDHDRGRLEEYDSGRAGELHRCRVHRVRVGGIGAVGGRL